MPTFMGGSAWAMARDIVDGYILVTATTMKKYTHEQLKQLKFELEKFQTSIRAEQIPQEDVQNIQLKNRKLSRITAALRVIEAILSSKKPSSI
jgi:septal ring factor EnvC (AmiA/AmiB activator)